MYSSDLPLLLRRQVMTKQVYRPGENCSAILLDIYSLKKNNKRGGEGSIFLLSHSTWIKFVFYIVIKIQLSIESLSKMQFP